MKLYTEEPLKIFYHLGKIDEFIGRQDDVNELIKDYPPIELPSDEQIHDECQIGGMDTNQQLCFQLGAKWMRDKILNK